MTLPPNEYPQFTVTWDFKAEAWFLIDEEGYYLDAWGVFRRLHEFDCYSPMYFDELEDSLPVMGDLCCGSTPRWYRIVGPSGIEDEVTV